MAGLIICVALLYSGFRWPYKESNFPLRKRVERWLELVAIWVVLVLPMVYVLLTASGDLPPWYWEHHVQKQRVKQAIISAGGWEELRSECMQLAKKYDDGGFQWIHGFARNWPDTVGTNYSLPPALAALKPRQVQYLPSRVKHKLSAGPDIEVVSIKIYGIHATGGHSTPYYGLEVVWGPGTNEYKPQPGVGVIGNRHSSFSKIAENIYEIY